MTYRGYTIYRELHGWQRTEINEDGTLGPDVRFTEDDSGSEYFGKGVDVSTVTRAHNDFLTREAATSQSAASGDAALDRMRKKWGAILRSSGLRRLLRELSASPSASRTVEQGTIAVGM